MPAPSTLTITYGSGPSTQTIPIPTPSGAGKPMEASQAMRNIALAGGAFFTDANGVQTFIPITAITKMTAQ